MSDSLTIWPIRKLLEWILAELDGQNSIFGIHRDMFFIPDPENRCSMQRFGYNLETPFGPAAGPHTQLAQNIISAWLCGARYFELKTVQTLDELDVTKPCIDMEDEGYNCEWSQELKLNQSFNTYLDAWILIHLLHKHLGFSGAAPGMIFNMSVGYNLEGILKPNVQKFLDRMAECEEEKLAKINDIKNLYPSIQDCTIPGKITDNITLSTMHGCPPEEIERICRYLISDRHLHVTLKLNPTLLGPEDLRTILNDQLGFDVSVPDLAFEHDLKYPDAVTMIKSLQGEAQKAGVEFNLKLTNTLEVLNTRKVLPEKEEMLYLSGRALHPISINVARKLQNEFHGHLDLSLSAGADCFNIVDILACNIKPVTTCTDLLKPGGYSRLKGYCDTLLETMDRKHIESLDDLVLTRSDKNGSVQQAGLENLNRYADQVVDNKLYQKRSFPFDNIKTYRDLTVFDCVQAPCSTNCAVSQRVPDYMFHTARGDFDKALSVILGDNPFPNITGMVCDHLCQTKCTRMNIDEPLQIRDIKKFNAIRHDLSFMPNPDTLEKSSSVAIIGAGPSGLACAYFCALRGLRVTIYEQKSFPGGMASDAIPAFRLDEQAIKKDIEAILSLGVTINYSTSVNADLFETLRQEFDYVYVAVGAQVSKKLHLPGEESGGITDQLTFLSQVRQGSPLDLGKKVAIIGGGNSCMDAARTAHRIVGPEGEVKVMYRRTQNEMPADRHEIEALLKEGIEIQELTAPEGLKIESGKVKAMTFSKMELGESDSSGRPRPVKIEGSDFDVQVDTIITAIGQDVVLDFLPEKTLVVDNQTGETQFANVFAGGDAVRGASTLIRAIGDGKKVAGTIISRSVPEYTSTHESVHKEFKISDQQKKLATREYGPDMPDISVAHHFSFSPVHPPLSEEQARKEALRCLFCNDMCNVCVSVCPNRVNFTYRVTPFSAPVFEYFTENGSVNYRLAGTKKITQKYQIFNLHEFCNECGNCSTFCPTNGDPYLTKPHLYTSDEEFEGQDGYIFKGDSIKAHRDDSTETLTEESDHFVYENDQVRAYFNKTDYSVSSISSIKNAQVSGTLEHALDMIVLLSALKDHPVTQP